LMCVAAARASARATASGRPRERDDYRQIVRLGRRSALV
jgi:hypothetical protein